MVVGVGIGIRWLLAQQRPGLRGRRRGRRLSSVSRTLRSRRSSIPAGRAKDALGALFNTAVTFGAVGVVEAADLFRVAPVTGRTYRGGSSSGGGPATHTGGYLVEWLGDHVARRARC